MKICVFFFFLLIFASGVYAGGCPNNAQWVNNRQYQISVLQPTQAYIVLSQPDIRKFGQKNDYHTIGFTLTKNGVFGKRTLEQKTSNIVKSTGFANTRDREVELVLQPNETYNIIPSTFEPGVEAGYKISVYSEKPVSFVSITEETDWKVTSVSGRWTAGKAGRKNLINLSKQQ